MLKNSVALNGIGLAIPEHSFKQSVAADASLSISSHTQTDIKTLRVLYKKTRVQQRGSVLFARNHSDQEPEQTFFQPQLNADDFGPGTRERMEIFRREAPRLALTAAQAALADSQTSAQTITHLIVVSCTGFSAPGVDFELIQELGLAPDVARTQIGFMGCHGALNGLRAAKAFAAENSQNKILLCCVEISSIHYAYELTGGSVTANALFADGASACVISSASPAPTAYTLGASGSFIFPNSENAMSWQIGNHGFAMTLSPEVPGIIETQLKTRLEIWLAESGLGISDIRSWAVHPGGPRILDAVEKGLELGRGSLDVSREILSAHGNMSSATVFFILERLRRAQSPRPCVALAFGPGLAAEYALFL